MTLKREDSLFSRSDSIREGLELETSSSLDHSSKDFKGIRYVLQVVNMIQGNTVIRHKYSTSTSLQKRNFHE